MVDLQKLDNEYPFTPKKIEIDGQTMSYLDEGEGEPLVFVHGNPTWSFYYRKLVSAFKDRYRCIAMDHIGCGLSSKPQQYEYTLNKHIDNMSVLMNNLNIDNATVCVHDWGGAIGLGWAGKNPERVKRLVIFNTGAFADPNIPPSINLCRLPVLGEVIVRQFNGFVGPAVTWRFATEKPERFTPEVTYGYMAPYDNWHNRVAIHRFVMDIPMSPDHPSRATLDSVEAGLEKLKSKPAMLAWGMKDFCFTSHFLNRFKQKFPQAESHEYTDAGHFVVEDASEQIIPAMDTFLRNNE